MDLLTSLGRTMGFSFAAGLNLYATVAILAGEPLRWVALPPQYQVFDNQLDYRIALVLYVVEFIADKNPVGRFGVGRGAHVIRRFAER